MEEADETGQEIIRELGLHREILEGVKAKVRVAGRWAKQTSNPCILQFECPNKFNLTLIPCNTFFYLVQNLFLAR